MRKRITRIIVGYPSAAVLASLWVTLQLVGCGDLGFIEIQPELSVSLRIENAAPDTVQVKVISSVLASLDPDSDDSLGSLPMEETVVRVLGGAVSTGVVPCADVLTFSVVLGDSGSAPVELGGDGTGTPGFDGGTVGTSGDRFLIAGTHYACEDTVLLQLPRSDSGELLVIPLGAAIPEPITGSSSTGTVEDGETDGTEEIAEEPVEDQVALRVANQTESTIQVRFSAGDGSLAGGDGSGLISSVEVRVPPFSTSNGTAICSAEYIISSTHLEGTSSIANGGGVNFHSVVLTGDGTGTDGFDSISLAVVDGRLLQRDVHYDCSNRITVTITASNNQLELDDAGSVVLDEFGNPTIRYNVGSGNLSVTPE